MNWIHWIAPVVSVMGFLTVVIVLFVNRREQAKHRKRMNDYKKLNEEGII